MDLPLHLGVDGAHTPDPVMGVHAYTRLAKLLDPSLPEAKIHSGIADTAYDATAFYELLHDLGIRPVIPLHPGTRTPADAGGHPRDPQGRPLCPGHLPYRHHGFNRQTYKQVYNCPAKRPGREQGQQLFRTHREECPLESLCEPDSTMGPLVYFASDDDPRLNPMLPRETPKYRELTKKRTAAERFFSVLKDKGGLDRRPYRRQYLFHIMATLKAVVVHARAWVRQRFGDGLPTTGESLVASLRSLAGET